MPNFTSLVTMIYINVRLRHTVLPDHCPRRCIRSSHSRYIGIVEVENTATMQLWWPQKESQLHISTKTCKFIPEVQTQNYT